VAQTDSLQLEDFWGNKNLEKPCFLPGKTGKNHEKPEKKSWVFVYSWLVAFRHPSEKSD
jgi:hypothetical protein